MRARYLLPLLIFQSSCSSPNETGTSPSSSSSFSDATAAGGQATISMPAVSGGAGEAAGGTSTFTPEGGRAGAGSGGAAGAAGVGGLPQVGDPEAPAGYVPALIGVGYGGIRIVSKDSGKTWGARASFSVNGGDDENLLRAVVYGKGLWLATGWKLVTSTDGKTWLDHGMINDGDFLPCNIIEGLAYSGGWFYAACSENPAVTFRSADGLKWSKYGTIGSTDGHLFLTYREGKFVAYGDNDVSYESSDGLKFTQMGGISQATFCAGAWQSQADCFDAAWFDGAYLRADWQGKISRSENGGNWTKVYDDDQQNTLYQARAIAPGYVAP